MVYAVVNEEGKFLRPSGSLHMWTSRLQHAQLFETQAEAQAEAGENGRVQRFGCVYMDSYRR